MGHLVPREQRPQPDHHQPGWNSCSVFLRRRPWKHPEVAAGASWQTAGDHTVGHPAHAARPDHARGPHLQRCWSPTTVATSADWG